MIIREDKKWGHHTPSTILTQMLTFLNSNATWAKIPYDPKQFKTVDSMRATYTGAAKYYGFNDSISVAAFSNGIRLTKERAKAVNDELDSILDEMKRKIKKAVLNGE